MSFPWGDPAPSQGGSGYGAQRQSRAETVVARARARAEAYESDLTRLRDSRQRVSDQHAGYELADIKRRAQAKGRAPPLRKLDSNGHERLQQQQLQRGDGNGRDGRDQSQRRQHRRQRNRQRDQEREKPSREERRDRRRASDQPRGGCGGELPPCRAPANHHRRPQQGMPAPAFAAFRSRSADGCAADEREWPSRLQPFVAYIRRLCRAQPSSRDSDASVARRSALPQRPFWSLYPPPSALFSSGII